MTLLKIKNLSVSFPTSTGYFKALDNFNLELKESQVMAVVGESGSGKSIAMLALMGLLPNTAKVTADSVMYRDINLFALSKLERRDIIGKEITMIFQEPMTSLNPSYTVGFQIKEMIMRHLGIDELAAQKEAIKVLEQVGIPSPEIRMKAYPHQLSGGMSQRVMIAIMLSVKPKLLIADEPTTALDVTIQAQILNLLIDLQKDYNMSMILITHDMGVVAQAAPNVLIQYAGAVMEKGKTKDVFKKPKHPYTQALLKSLPELATNKEALYTIPGVVPGPYEKIEGCSFSPRCAFAKEKCFKLKPEYNLAVRCHYPIKSN